MIDPRHPDYSCTPAAATRARFAYAPAGGPGSVVTVVTPYFNTGEVFHETARCVLGQSLQAFEWIIVNDATTDPAALAVLAGYRALARSDPRVRVIDHPKNLGLSAARNTGFRHARAPLVFMLDSDDLIEPTTIEKCALFLECNPAFSFVKGNTVGFGGQQYLWDKGFHDGAAILDENRMTATAMVRRSVHEAVGGFDETIRGGLEDWEFWVRAAGMGHWGATIPEYLDWYRRRPGAAMDAWANLACSRRQQHFRERLRAAHPRLFTGGFPAPARAFHGPHAEVPERMPWGNPLAKERARILMILPWLRMGGADKFNLDLIRGLTGRGWEVTVATTLGGHPWLPEFTRLTPDVFLLDHLAPLPDFPRLLRYLVESRRPDHVLISNSELGYYALPMLRACCPGPAYLDVNHMEEPRWKNGGHPRQGAAMHEQLDLSVVISDHLRRWMVDRGADPQRTEVCHINVDTGAWKPDAALRARSRERLGIRDNDTVLLYPVRLTAQKQPMVFADAVRRLGVRLAAGGDRSGFVALVAGDGELMPPLRAYLDRHGMNERVRLLGAVKIDDMPGLYAAADVLFLPSLHEGIALTLYEAMACGVPVVAAEVGGQAELVRPGTGFLLPPNDDKASEAEAYAEALERLMRDRDLRDQTGRAAREHVLAHHTQDRMIARMEQLLALAAHHRRTRPRAALTPALAREFAATGVDWLRFRDLAEELWAFREEARRREREEARRRDAADAAAGAALAHIESSGSYCLIQRCKHLPGYGVYARARFGPGWKDGLAPAPGEPPSQRLARIKASRSYRVVVRIKSLPPARLVSRIRHGAGYRDTLPHLLREDK